jgi:hypothetical protein
MPSPTPLQIRRSIVRLNCSQCGAEANASCSCGKPYVPVIERVAEYDKAKPNQSTRQAAADLGIPKSTVADARAGVRARTPEAGEHQYSPAQVTGRDGKTYKKPYRQRYIQEVDMMPSIQYDLLDKMRPIYLAMNDPTRMAWATWQLEISRSRRDA